MPTSKSPSSSKSAKKDTVEKEVKSAKAPKAAKDDAAVAEKKTSE